MTRPRILDLFCGAGGAGAGYARAGFDVVGVDLSPQPHYPFEFIQADWEEPLSYLPGLWEREGVEYAIHASPPCQRYSTMTKKWQRDPDEHPDLIDPVRDALEAIEPPLGWVIENVISAPLRDPVMLCGSMFGLGAWVCGCGVAVDDALGKYGCPNCEGEQARNGRRYGLRRHRIFEVSTGIPFAPASCAHEGPALPVYGHAGGSSKRDGLKFPGTDAWKLGMQIDWMTGAELKEAIPPAFTEYIAQQLLIAADVNRNGVAVDDYMVDDDDDDAMFACPCQGALPQHDGCKERARR